MGMEIPRFQLGHFSGLTRSVISNLTILVLFHSGLRPEKDGNAQFVNGQRQCFSIILFRALKLSAFVVLPFTVVTIQNSVLVSHKVFIKI